MAPSFSPMSYNKKYLPDAVLVFLENEWITFIVALYESLICGRFFNTANEAQYGGY